jgi:pyruvate formate lyase activating enzyme
MVKQTSIERKAARMATSGAADTPTIWHTTSPESPYLRLRGKEDEKPNLEPSRCSLCPHLCQVLPDALGACQARRNKGGVVVCDNYGMTTSLSLDPIEKKPLADFHPKTMVLSWGSWGCNLRCPFCQNSDISLEFDEAKARATYLSPSDFVARAVELKPKGCVGVAFTYNEPTISREYVRDVSRVAHAEGLVTVLVSNGYACEGPWSTLLKSIDAVNVDLKAFTPEFYARLGAPDGLEVVKRSIEIAHDITHVEVSTLVVPAGSDGSVGADGLPGNDSPDEIDRLSTWIASVDKDIPLHLAGFVPRYKLRNRSATQTATLHTLAEVARRHLTYVYGD